MLLLGNREMNAQKTFRIVLITGSHMEDQVSQAFATNALSGKSSYDSPRSYG